MPLERIVVSFCARGPQAASDDVAELDRVRSVLKRAEALGATICSWSETHFALAFGPDDLEEVVGMLSDPETAEAHGHFGMGVSQGQVQVLAESRGSIELGRGEPIVRALALSSAAGAGEVLLDADMEGVRGGVIATLEAQTTETGVRGCKLPREGSQPDAPAAGEGIQEPATLVGAAEGLAPMALEPGTLGIVRADAGTGGSRFLRECLAASPGRTLLLQPAGFSAEPLGALRRAFAREVSRSGMVNLPHNERKVLDALLRGAGASIDAAAYVIEEWLSPPGVTLAGTVVVDDVNEIDSTSLDVIAASVLGATRPFRCIARLDGLSPLPAQLAPLPPGPEVELKPLSQQEAEVLAASWVRAEAGPWAARYALRGAGVPLAVGEALQLGLSTGELVVAGGKATDRARTRDPGRSLSARDWIAARWAALDSQCRSLLQAVAVLGGDASMDMADALLRAAADAPVDLELASSSLRRRGWLVQPEPDWLALPSRTHAQVVLDALPDTRRPSWFRAASLVIEAREGEFAHAEAARLASLAGDRKRAARLYLEASRSAEAALLESTARELGSCARSEDPSLADAAGVPSVRKLPRVSFHAPASNFAAALLSRAPTSARSSYPPIEIPMPSGKGASADVAGSDVSPKIPPPPAVPSDPSLQEASKPRLGSAMRRRTVDELAAELPVPGREGTDLSKLQAWIEREPETAERDRLLARLKAILSLEKGGPADKGEALRVLRASCRLAQNGPAVERSRSHLALAVGLARTGQAIESLVEALEALAFARDAADSKAEKACVALLQKLYVASGHGEQASAWVETVEPRA